MKRILSVALVLISFVAVTERSVNIERESKLRPRRIFYVLKTSWYGPGFHGRKTANGEVYNMHNLTAAHRTWPFGTKLRLINPKENKTVVAVINDRGPYDPKYLTGKKKKLRPYPDRYLDVSYETAKELGMIRDGTAELLVEILR